MRLRLHRETTTGGRLRVVAFAFDSSVLEVVPLRILRVTRQNSMMLKGLFTALYRECLDRGDYG